MNSDNLDQIFGFYTFIWYPADGAGAVFFRRRNNNNSFITFCCEARAQNNSLMKNDAPKVRIAD